MNLWTKIGNACRHIRNWWSTLLSWDTPSKIIKEYEEGKKKAKKYKGE